MLILQRLMQECMKSEIARSVCSSQRFTSDCYCVCSQRLVGVCVIKFKISCCDGLGCISMAII